MCSPYEGQQSTDQMQAKKCNQRAMRQAKYYHNIKIPRVLATCRRISNWLQTTYTTAEVFAILDNQFVFDGYKLRL